MFALDQNAARAADNKSAFIDEAGKYIGTFTRAEYMEKQETGSTGIGFTFKSREGAEGQFYVNLSYQHGTRNDGGYQLINALMACMSLRNLGDPQPIEIEKWDNDAKQRVKATVPGFPELMNKEVGLLIQMEIEKKSEKGLPRPTIFAPFSAESEKTASEILDTKKPAAAKLEKMVQQVMNKPLVDRRPAGSRNLSGGDDYAAYAGSAQRHDDDPFGDIPFD
ncbi:hypothetical protein MT1_3774 [Pseudomonas sp. MT-1]|uniref:hypothetical protein n=1 Tax=Stutzerimonas stutzeri TaxID=316 RepID=UPI000535DC41|nr:hypothetical protein [Stutzerimonas stutzeri]MCQ4282597.1 hypothetical protein [Stutzerimonas stutzeri]BAP80949.1 hypothetical protein MT1_3774 [Pseudomonas sp. MT-1]